METSAVVMFLAGWYAVFVAAVKERKYKRVLKENQELKTKLGRM